MYIVQPAVDGGHRRQLIGDGREHEREGERASGSVRHRPRAGCLAGCSLGSYGMASPECTAFNSTLSIERRDGGRGRTTTISESTNDDVPRNATPSYGNRPLLAFLKPLISALATV